ncbi:MAG: 3-oxoacyl-ACP synthase III [Planctomycetota bacterium]
MRYTRVALPALGYELPPRVVSSAALEDRLAPLYKKLEMPAGRLELISGVRERRFWEPNTPPSSKSVISVRRALESAALPVERVGALVHTSVCRDYLEPATASVVAGQLGLRADAMVFDISNACLGFLNGIVVIANMIELGQIEAGVVVSTEAGEALVDATVSYLLEKSTNGVSRRTLKPSFASLTIGSGSVAAVLTNRELKDGPRLLGGACAQATEHFDLCRSAPDQGFAGGATPLMETSSDHVLRHGCDLAARAWGTLKNELGWTEETPDQIVCHQVGSSYRKQLFQSLDLDLGKDHPTVEWLGNIGSVSLPISLALANEEGKLGRGDQVALLGIGSGLNCVMLGVEWA